MNLALGFGLQKNSIGSNVNQIPSKSLATLWLDGSIIDVLGSKYFVDRIGGNNVLITGYDFPAGWVKGFPYKSAATIDIFGLTGVPVVSLFQNIDYGNQYFTRHVAQVVDGNGVETSEAYVADIVAYSAPLTGADLTAANTYYGVPAEITTNVRWVSKDGNDTTGNGSKATPWKTLVKASYTATVGYTVYVKSGEYKEDHTGNSGGYWYLLGAHNYKALGKVAVTSFSADRIVGIPANGLPTFDRFIFSDSGNKYSLDFLGAGASPVTISKCLFNNTNYSVKASATGAPALVLNDNIFKATNARHLSTGLNAVTGTGNYIYGTNLIVQAGTASTVNIDLRYNRINIGTLNLNAPVNLTFFNNIVTNSAGIIGEAATVINSTLNFKRNIVTSGTIYNLRIVTGRFTTLNIEDNTLTDGASATAVSILLTNQPVNNVLRNTLIAPDGKYAQIAVDNRIATDTALVVQNNYLVSRTLADGVIVIGNESAVGYDKMSGLVSGNRVKGILDYSAGTPTSHLCVVFNNSKVKIEHNKISGGSLGIVYKNLGLDSSVGHVLYNHVKNCINGIVVKGCANLKVNNNTVEDCTGDHVNFVVNGASTPANNVLRNNIFVNKLAASGSIRAIFNQSTGLTSNNNTLHFANNTDIFNNGALNLALAAWRAAGFDADSIATDPTLTGGIPATPVTGVDLGADYDTGIDITSTLDALPPVLVTKEQSATWQMGAYVQ